MMKLLRMIATINLLFFILPISSDASNQNGGNLNRDIKMESEKILSMKQVKHQLRKMLKGRDQCGVGSCYNDASLNICDYIGLVNERLNGELGFGMSSSGKSPGLSVTKVDKELLMRFVKSCKMTTYQYWNYPMFTHVGFGPDEQDRKWIYNKLGMKLTLKI